MPAQFLTEVMQLRTGQITAAPQPFGFSGKSVSPEKILKKHVLTYLVVKIIIIKRAKLVQAHICLDRNSCIMQALGDLLQTRSKCRGGVCVITHS